MPFLQQRKQEPETSNRSGELSCNNVSLNSAGNLVVPISINRVAVHAGLDNMVQIAVLGSKFVDFRYHLCNFRPFMI